MLLQDRPPPYIHPRDEDHPTVRDRRPLRHLPPVRVKRKKKKTDEHKKDENKKTRNEKSKRPRHEDALATKTRARRAEGKHLTGQRGNLPFRGRFTSHRDGEFSSHR
eukprot:1180875-Prorocentrum_minimum.AAC.1